MATPARLAHIYVEVRLDVNAHQPEAGVGHPIVRLPVHAYASGLGF